MIIQPCHDAISLSHLLEIHLTTKFTFHEDFDNNLLKESREKISLASWRKLDKARNFFFGISKILGDETRVLNQGPGLGRHQRAPRIC
jgi:hypothetical protein